MAIKLKITRHKEHPAPLKTKTKLVVERVKTSQASSPKKTITKKKTSSSEVKKEKKTSTLAPGVVKKKSIQRTQAKKSSLSLTVGDAFPTFSLPSSEGGFVSSDALRGEKYVLYFYPKDMTSGCATEAREFSLLSAEFAHLGYRIFGVSADSLDRHQKFIAKEHITFPLLSDEMKDLARACGVLHPGIRRTTFIVDGRGNIERVYEKVVAKGHSVCVYKDLQSQKTSA